MEEKYGFLERLGIADINVGAYCGALQQCSGEEIISSVNPATGEVIACVQMANDHDYDLIVQKAKSAFAKWRSVPAPQRGIIVREICNEIARKKDDLGKLIALEVGKIVKEGMGEVQEIIDLEQLTSGCARGKKGSFIHSERENHELYTMHKPLGIVGVITAFNFPMAVWGWNVNNILPTGNVCIWKPSLQAPLSAIALHRICADILHTYDLDGVLSIVIGADDVVGEALINDERVPLISFTGSTKVGRHIYETVARRVGKPPILELGGNNPVIVLDDADIDVALENVFFGFVGTTAQRCTTTRRLFLHKHIYDEFMERLLALCEHIRFGDPFNPETVAGPLISGTAVQHFMDTQEKAVGQGAMLLRAGVQFERQGFFVSPAIAYVNGKKQIPIMREEAFVPMLYVMKIDTVEEGVALANEVPQQLSAGIFTENMHSAYYFREHCVAGICNINAGTSGAESSLPFGGNYHTGWGREAGGDAWKQYTLQNAGVINYSGATTLAQGIDFFKKKKKEK